jgi:hypothetical protein
MAKTLVLFVFDVFNARVQNFIDNCIFFSTSVDFIVISNNKSNKFTVPDYVKTFFRENIGYDFGGWSDALLIDNLYKNYDNYIFVNSSVIGPFVPAYFKGHWTDIYIHGLQGNVKLFGTAINTANEKGVNDPLRISHVQSYIFSMDKTTLEYLITCEIFSMTNYAANYVDAIHQKEILMSRKIVENKWNLGCLYPAYKNVDFTFAEKKPNEYDRNFFKGDFMFEKYRNTLWNEYELVFLKGNRDIPMNLIHKIADRRSLHSTL